VPTGLQATAGNANVALTWSGQGTSYVIERAAQSGGPYTAIATPSVASYTDVTVTNGSTYFYEVAAVNSAGTSAPSTAVSATPKSSGTPPAAPPAPTGLQATGGNARITLTWSGEGTSYVVERATHSGGPYAQIATPTAAAYTDTTVSNGTTYFYVVAAVNAVGPSALSTPVSATPKSSSTPPVVPPAPTALQATAGTAEVALTWSGQGTSYRVERATQSGGPYTQIAVPTTTAYTDTTVTNGTTYFYVVAAVNSAGTSALSTQASATPTAQTNLVFDLDGAHEFIGFGAETFVSSEHLPQLTQVLTDTGANFHRTLPISPALLPGDLKDEMSVAELLALFNLRETAEWKATTTQFATLMKSLKLSTEFTVAGMPSPWVIITTGADGHKHYTANPARLQVYANYVVAEAMFALQAGFPITFMEGTGEPNGDWGTLYTPALYAQLMALVHEGLVANGLTQIQLEGPGTSVESAAAPFIDALVPGIKAGYIKAIDVHAYDSAELNVDVFGFPDSMKAALAALPTPGLPIHVTEFNEENHAWDGPPYCGGPNSTCTDNNSADSPDYAVSVVALALNQYNQGVNKASIWQAQDQSWEQTSRGMINLAGNSRPSAHAVADVFGPLGNGEYHKTVGGVTSLPGVYATAFFAEPNGTVTALSTSFANTGTSAVTVVVNIQHTATLPSFSIASQSLFLGSGKTSPANAATLAGGTLSVSLPPRSVVTVTLGF